MEDVDQPPAPPTPQPPPSPDAVLAEQLAQCSKAVAECFVCGSDSRLPLLTQLEHLNVAERLMRVSIALAAALGKSGKEFTHRMIVERPEKVVEIIHGTEAFPHPPIRKLKTNHGGRTTEEHKIG